MSFAGIARALNGTALESEEETKAVYYEDKVFKITLLFVALCVLAITGIIVCASYCKHRGRGKRAYASVVMNEVAENTPDLTYVKRTQSFRNLFGRREIKDNSRIYYIFSNPIPVVSEDDDRAPRKASTCAPLTLEDYAKDPKNGITLNPPVFYMQI